MAFTTVNKGFTQKNGVTYDLQYNTQTGDVQIIQQNAPPGTKPIYQDGKWLSTPAASSFNATEQTQIHSQAIVSIQSAYNAIGGKNSGANIPQWASKNFTNGQPGQTSVTPNSAASGTQGSTSNGGSGNIFSSILNPGQTLSNIAVNGGQFGVGNEEQLFGGTTNMKYPDDLMTSLQDHFVISMFSYKPSSQAQLFKGGTQGALSILKSGLQNSGNLEKRIGTVYLPMPQSVSDSNNVSWGGENMGNIAAAVAADTMGNVGKKGMQALAGAMVGGVLGTGMKATASKFMQGANLIGLLNNGAQNNDSLKTLVTSDVTSKLVKAQGFAVESESILARGAGIVPNSNLELLFNSPTLRSFTFTYRLSPRSEEEAKTVRRIIRFFKQGMAVKKLSGKSGQASFFLGTPNVFKLEYRNGTKQIDGVNKFKSCALTSFSCNFTPEGMWAAYEAGQPISTVISMKFDELEPIFDTDYQENNIFAGLGESLSSVNSNSVGY